MARSSGSEPTIVAKVTIRERVAGRVSFIPGAINEGEQPILGPDARLEAQTRVESESQRFGTRFRANDNDVVVETAATEPMATPA